MSKPSDRELVPRNGHTLMVAIVCRISGCPGQKDLSLEDQEDYAKEAVGDLYQGPVEFHVIATKGKGERLDRPEVQQIEAEFRSRKYDLFVFDELSRLIRGGEAVRFLGVGVDNRTRSICLKDDIDTIDPTWEEDALNACSENVAHNERTSRRIKQKTMNRFVKYGHAAARPIYGYIVPPDATGYGDWLKDNAATPWIKEGECRLRQSRNCTALADWFNEQGVPVGPGCRSPKWTGPMVRRFYKNTLLKGMPGRGHKHTVKHHGSGRRMAVNNPKGAKFFECPHLAHLEPAEFDSLNQLLAESNARYTRKAVKGVDVLLGRPRKRTRFPGQHARCWYCGRHYVWGGNGVTKNLMCPGARERRCWNSISFEGGLAATRLVDQITSCLYQLDGIDDQFAEMVAVANQGVGGGLADRWAKHRHDQELLDGARKNVEATIKAYGPSPIVQEMLAEFETTEKKLAWEAIQLRELSERSLVLPSSIPELRATLEESFKSLAVESPEFGDLLRLLIPEFHVYLVRLCDGSHLLPRALIKLNLMGSIADAALVPGLEQLMTRQITIDLFEEPPQRERIRLEAVRLEAEGVQQRKIATLIEKEQPKQAAVFNALQLDRKMQTMGLTTPYVLVTEPPDDYPKLRLHKHAKFRFEPLEGYQRPTL